MSAPSEIYKFLSVESDSGKASRQPETECARAKVTTSVKPQEGRR